MGSSGKDNWPREKRWKLVYTRSAKLLRAQKLGFDYPRITDRRLVERETDTAPEKRNVLFVCSKNQWRSPTAATVWAKHPWLEVRSGGTSSSARHTVSVDDIQWADVILVMEEKHRAWVFGQFRRAAEGKPLHVLGIPDEYRYMDPHLVELLEDAVGAALGLAPSWR